MTNVNVTNCFFDGGICGVRILSGGSWVDQINIDGITGNCSAYGVVINVVGTIIDKAGVGNVGYVRVANVNLNISYDAFLPFNNVVVLGCNAQTIDLENINGTLDTSQDGAYIFHASGTIQSLNVKGATVHFNAGHDYSYIRNEHGLVTYPRYSDITCYGPNSPYGNQDVFYNLYNSNYPSLSNITTHNMRSVVYNPGAILGCRASGITTYGTYGADFYTFGTMTPFVLSNYMPISSASYKITGAITSVTGDGSATGDGAIVLEDNFDRVNSTSSLGSLVTPVSAWTVVNGTWGINNNQAYCSSETSTGSFTPQKAVIDAGVANFTYSATVTLLTSNSYAALLYRYTDASNYYYLEISPNTVSFYKVVSGTFTLLTSQASSNVGRNNFRVDLSGTGIVVKKNNATLITTTDGTYTTQTKVGICVDSGTGLGGGVRIDNISLRL